MQVIDSDPLHFANHGSKANDRYTDELVQRNCKLSVRIQN